MLWAEVGMAAFALALCVMDHALFAALPPLPPSASASAKRSVHLLEDCVNALRNPGVVLLALAFGISTGTYGGWAGVLDPILAPLGYSQTTANWLGFAATIGCCAGGVVFGVVGDRVKRVKRLLIGLLFASAVLFAWFTLLATKGIPPSTWQLFTSCFLGW